MVCNVQVCMSVHKYVIKMMSCSKLPFEILDRVPGYGQALPAPSPNGMFADSAILKACHILTWFPMSLHWEFI